MLTASEWLSENSERQELALQNIPLAMELYAKYRETELSRPTKDVVEAIEKAYPVRYAICQNTDGSPSRTDTNKSERTAALHGYSLASGDKWVSVNDRLPVCQPEKLCHCLVIAPRSFPKNCEVVVAEFYDDNNTFYSESGDNPMEDVTHWMYVPELPSPPKQQQQ